ncbi:MAG: hypothetical protein IJ985_01200 [Akkermansia sp.]|nr:hypothetical protein [Akkermansia sp.]
MLNSKRMARTLTAPEALAWYFKRRPAFVKDICWHVATARSQWGTTRQRHAESALDAMADPVRVNAFLLQHADDLALDTTTRSALENDAAEMRAYTARMHTCLANPWA